MARARFFPVSAQMCQDPALTGPSLHRGQMRRSHPLSYSAAIERFATGVFASNFARCVEKRPHITDVRRTRKKPSRKFIAGRHVSQIRIGKQLDAEIERDIAKLPQAVAEVQVRDSNHAAAVSVDSA